MPRADVVLLDTHVLLWWQAGSNRLSVTARRSVDDAARVLVSPITCWEVAMLVCKQRIRLDRDTGKWVRDVLAGERIELAVLSAAIAVAAAELSGFHGDPADRFLYATARSQQVPLVTKDRLMHRYAAEDGGVSTLW